MRKCIRCETEMNDGYALFEGSSRWRIFAAEDKGLFPRETGRLSCAVCPVCGYVELYVKKKGS
ncbi:MAG: hypothetical protein HFI88_09770 [Lachnospiraceae bacterium]|nr:hypothetical protein [Lachnospiraceae bacterium]